MHSLSSPFLSPFNSVLLPSLLIFLVCVLIIIFLLLIQGANKPSVTASSVFRCDYNVYSTFQSHEPEFDYLKSLEIEEKINQICWVKQTGSSLFLLTTNGMRIYMLL